MLWDNMGDGHKGPPWHYFNDNIGGVVWGEEILWKVGVLRTMGYKDANCCATIVTRTRLSNKTVFASSIKDLWKVNKIN
jgi:hypothetical protein